MGNSRSFGPARVLSNLPLRVKQGYHEDLKEKDFREDVDGAFVSLEADTAIHCAEIYVHENTTAETVGNGYTKMTAFQIDGGINGYTSGLVTPDKDNSKLIVKISRPFRFQVSLAFSGSPSLTYVGAVFVGGVEMENIHFTRKLNSTGDTASATMSGFVDITASDAAPVDVDLRVRNGDATGSKPITIIDCSLSIFNIGH